MKPSNFMFLMSATAENREMVAMLPLSRYRNGPRGALPARRREIWSAASRPPWTATWATAGRLPGGVAVRCRAGAAARGLVGRVAAALDGHLGDAGQLVGVVGHVADDVDLRVAGQCEVRLHRDAPGAVDLGAGLLAQQPAQRRRLDARRPHLGGRGAAPLGAVAVLAGEAGGAQVG